jgi:endonuclease-8
MPEGDTIFRTARTLQRVLAGKQILRFLAQANSIGAGADSEMNGQTINAVESHGKNLLIRFSNGFTLHTHMKMTGSWHVYRPGERWRKPAFQARIVLEVADFVAVCFNAPVVQLVKEPRLSHLGPDVLKDPDVEKILGRMRAHPEMPIGEVILNQTILAGVGNIYKSESLFWERISPFASVNQIEDDGLRRLLLCVTQMMRQSANAVARSKRWVYRRSGKPCYRCGAVIEMKRQSSRSTYFCPQCQQPTSDQRKATED